MSPFLFKAQPKHLSCIAVSAFHLACVQHQHHLKHRQHLVPNQDVSAQHLEETAASGAVNIPDPADLVTISQSRCSPSDLLRMQGILATKLDLCNPDKLEPCSRGDCPLLADPPAVTPLTILRVMFSVSKAASLRLGLDDLLPDALPDNLVHKLEILVCDSLILSHRYGTIQVSSSSSFSGNHHFSFCYSDRLRLRWLF